MHLQLRHRSDLLNKNHTLCVIDGHFQTMLAPTKTKHCLLQMSIQNCHWIQIFFNWPFCCLLHDRCTVNNSENGSLHVYKRGKTSIVWCDNIRIYALLPRPCWPSFTLPRRQERWIFKIISSHRCLDSLTVRGSDSQSMALHPLDEIAWGKSGGHHFF